MSALARLCGGLVAAALLPLALRAVPATAGLEMAVTVDDLPSLGHLPARTTMVDVADRMIRTLTEYRVPGVYGFVNGYRMKIDPNSELVLRRWVDAGFLLGNHTYSHSDLDLIDAHAFERDIDANEPLLRSMMGERDWHWFRYPFLHRGDTLEERRQVAAYLHDHGYRIAQVTLDFRSYAWEAPFARCVATGDSGAIEWLKTSYLSAATEQVALSRQVARLLFGRDIKHVLLLHIGAFESLMLPALLAQLNEQGARFVSLSEADADPAYRDDPYATLGDDGPLLDVLVRAKRLRYPPHAAPPLQKLDALCR